MPLFASPSNGGRSLRWIPAVFILILILTSATTYSSPVYATGLRKLSADPFIQQGSHPVFSPSAADLSTADLRPPFSPAPAVTVSTGAVLLGENFTITATFENNGDGSGRGPTGYGPFIDLYIPHKGAEGVFPNESTYDGISPASGLNYTASLDGESLTVVTQTFPDDGGGSGCVNHPWGLDVDGFFLEVCGDAGDQLVSIQLPYGSYTPAQPQLTISVPARLSVNANPGTPLIIRGRGGFIYGATPMVDWCCTVPVDTTLVSDSGAPSTWSPFSSLNPQVISFTKNTSAGEVATGPNSPATFTISVDLAPDQSFSNIDITDSLPNNLVYLGNLITSPPADTVSQPAVDGLPHNGDTISLHWDGPIDSSTFSSISASFDYYIPELDADGSTIAPGTTTNQATLDQIIWTPADGSPTQDLSTGIGIGTASTSDQPLTLGKGRSLAVDNGTAGFTPGDIIRYSLTFEISDYFGFDNLNLEDILPDGQHYYRDATYFPTLAITRDGATSSYTFNSDNIEVDCNYSGGPGGECDLSSGTGNPGETVLSFDIDQELVDQGANSQLLGDYVVDGGSIANATTTGTVQFYAIMLDKYTDIHPAPNNYVKMGDSQTNTASISGSQVDPDSCDPGPCTITAVVSGNSAAAGITVGTGSVDKAIVGVNGAYCNAGDPCSSVSIAAGDTVTYRIQYDLLTGDFSDLLFTDFLPLPIFYAEDPNADGSSLSTWPQDTVNAIPDPGTWDLGTNDTHGHIPVVTLSPHTVDNYVRFDFGDHDDPANNPAVIEILFTVRVTDERFGDGLRMRNSVLQQDSNSPGVTSTSSNNVDLTLTEPVLVGEKSVVSTDNSGVDPDPPIAAPIVFVDPGNPASTPWNTGSTISSNYLDANGLNSGIEGIDGGDLVKFALVIENTGSGINGAYDIAIKDTLPSGYQIPGIGLGGFNLQVYRGDGLALDNGSGSGLEYLGTNNNPTDFFENGIRLRDPEDNPAFDSGDPEYGQGLCQAHDATNGENIIIVTYDLQVDPNVSPGSVLQNVGEILEYSGEEGGENYLPGPEETPQDSTIDVPSLEKTRTGTGLVEINNDDDQVVIGEEIYYQLEITFPEGSSPETVITDSLDSGLGFISQDSFTSSTDISFDGSSTPVITDGGRTITWNLGTVTNSNSDNSTPETITITYTVQALNVSSSQHGSSLDNSVEISWEALDSEGSTVTLTEGPVNADAVAVVEPQIDVSKTVVVGGAGNTGDAGDSVEYTITFTANASRPTAYEADLSDFLPIDIDFSSGSYGISGVTDSEGILNIASFEITPGRELRLLNDNPIVMAPGRSVTITLTGELEDTVFTGQTIINTAQMTWSSQTGDQSSGAEDGERDGSDGVGGLNDYQSPNSATINVIDPSPGKIIVSTSEDHTGTISGTPRLVIGEILRYRIEVRLAEGTSNDMILRDNLPAGLVFLNDSTARVVFVADTPANISSSSPPNSDPPGIVDAGAFVSGDETSVSGITPTVALGDENISSTLGGNNDSYGSGTDVYFKLGDVFNSEADLNSEFAVIEFNALVANVLGNQRGTTRNNSFTVYVDEDGDGDAESNEDIETSSPVSVVIAEPTLSVTKTILTAPSDAGDPITYQLVISNPDNGNNDAAGFDLVLTDTFDSYLGSLSIDPVATTQGGTCLGNGSGTTAYSDDGGSFTGQVLTFTASCLDQSQTITLTINAVLANDIPAGYDLQNTANLTWTSLPGGKGTASNPTGSDVDDTGTTEDESGGSRGERNGSESPGVNDYTTPGSENLVLDVPLVNKTVSPLAYAVGEVITYNLVITLPEGITPDMVFHDDLPAGLEYLSHDVIISAAASGGALSNDFNGSFTNDYTNPAFITAPGGSGGDLSIVFGTSDTVADNNSNNDSFLIRITARLLNEIGNQYPDILTNAAEIQYSSGTTATGSVDVMVIEPVVSLDKTSAVVTPASGTATLGAVIEYTLALSNPSATSSAAAFDMILTDTIPTGLTYVPGSISAPAGWTADDSSAPGLTWTSNSGTSLALDATVSLTYRATIDSPGMPNEPSPGQILTNAVDLVWTSLDGPSTEERDGTDGPGGFLNDYAASTDEDITVENIDLRIEKDDGGVSFDAGDIVVYDLNSYNDGSIDATGVVINETVPVNTTFDLAGSSGVWSCPDNSPAGTVCTQTLGTVSPSVGVPTVVQFAVAIDNPLPAAVTTITNNVSIADDGSNGPEPTPGNNSDSVITPSIGANPDLTITKDDGIEIGAPGTGMVYTLVYENVGTQDATGVVITETVSTGVTFDLGNSTSGWVVQGTGVPAVDGEPAGTVLEFEIGNVNAGDAPVSIDFAVVVDNPLAAGITEITNTASIADDGSNGPDLTPDDNSDDDVDGIAVQGKDLDSQLHGVTTLPDVAIGEILTYEVVLTVPDGSMPGLHLIDSLDRGLGFVDCESISATGLTTTVVGGFSTVCSSPAVSELPVGSAAEEDQGRQIDFDFGTLANNTGNVVDLVLRYQVAVLDSINNQSDSTPPLNNQAEWVWDSGSLSEQAVGVTILEPDLNLQKNASPTVLYPGQITTFTLVVDHDASSQTPAYNLVLTDIIPDGLIYQPPIRHISGQAPTAVDDTGNPTLILEWDVFLNNGQNSVIEIDVMLDPDFRRTYDKQTITNDASLSWTSLPGDFSAPQSAYNVLSTERYYDPLSNVDIYQAADDARIRIPALPDTGFAPGRITEIPLQFPEQTYEEMSGLVLEIPALELTLPIVSVPITSQGYDLTWLSSQAGWLEGSAYPSWVGNTVITGHAYLSSGLPGPFVDLEKLSWGDEIIIEANGLEYTYQVREKALVSGDDLSILRHKDQDWLTLFTCKDFSEELGQYRWRQVVEAVLISVEDIP